LPVRGLALEGGTPLSSSVWWGRCTCFC